MVLNLRDKNLLIQIKISITSEKVKLFFNKKHTICFTFSYSHYLLKKVHKKSFFLYNFIIN